MTCGIELEIKSRLIRANLTNMQLNYSQKNKAAILDIIKEETENARKKYKVDKGNLFSFGASKLIPNKEAFDAIENSPQYIKEREIEQQRENLGVIPLRKEQTTSIKEGVAELFESNLELANAVYEALGFKSKPDVILPIGTSGSGKSTFVKSLPQENLVIIEPDAMRVEFTGDMNDKSKDKEIYEEAANRAIQAIKQGKQVVFDTTNLTKDKRLPFIEAIKKAIPTANIQYKLMELNPELAKQRIKADIAAGKNRANVPDSTIDRHAESYKQMLEDIKNEPISNFELAPQQKQQTQQLYSQYLDTIFPDSKVKDIVYHGSKYKFENFKKAKLGNNTKCASACMGFFFANNIDNSKKYMESSSEIQDYEKIELIDNYKYIHDKNDYYLEKIEEIIKDYSLEKAENILKEIQQDEISFKKENPDFSFVSFPNVTSTDIQSKEKLLFYSEKEVENYVNNLKARITKEDRVKKINNIIKSFDGEKYSYTYDIHKIVEPYFLSSVNDLINISNEIIVNTKELEGYYNNIISEDNQEPTLYNVLLNTKDIIEYDDKSSSYREETYYKRILRGIENNKDGVIIRNTFDPLETDVFIVFEPEQIHILGSKQDIEGFKEFINSQKEITSKIKSSGLPDLNINC